MERMSFSFARKEPLAYISHLDLMRLFLRALRRSNLPLAYSQGYNPHPRLTLALPLPLGVTASAELGEIYFAEPVGSEKFIKTLGQQLPEALELLGASSVGPEMPALASIVSAAHYRAVLNNREHKVERQVLQQALDNLMGKEEIILERRNKKKKLVKTNVRPYIFEMTAREAENKPVEFGMLLKAGSSGGVSPFFIIEQLQLEMGSQSFVDQNWLVHRERLYAEQNGILQPLKERM